jgi:hypothetical protein
MTFLSQLTVSNVNSRQRRWLCIWREIAYAFAETRLLGAVSAKVTVFHFNLLQGRCRFPLAHKHPNRAVVGVDSLEAPFSAQENASGKSPGYIDTC